MRLLVFLPAILIPTCGSSSPTFHMMYSAQKLNKQGDNIQPWRTPFPILNVSCSMFSSNCCFLTCIQVSQDAGKVVWYSHLFKNFPQFVVIYIVKGFSTVNEAEVEVFLEIFSIFYDPTHAGNLMFPLPLLNPASTSKSSWFTYCWSLVWEREAKGKGENERQTHLNAIPETSKEHIEMREDLKWVLRKQDFNR